MVMESVGGQYRDNVVWAEQYMKAHPGTVISCEGYVHSARRDGTVIAHSRDLGSLLRALEAEADI
jgi:hypothetical protein